MTEQDRSKLLQITLENYGFLRVGDELFYSTDRFSDNFSRVRIIEGINQRFDFGVLLLEDRVEPSREGFGKTNEITRVRERVHIPEKKLKNGSVIEARHNELYWHRDQPVPAERVFVSRGSSGKGDSLVSEYYASGAQFDR